MQITIDEFNCILKRLCDRKYMSNNGGIVEFRIYKMGKVIKDQDGAYISSKKEIVLEFAKNSIELLSIENKIRTLLIELERNNIKISNN